MKNITIDKSKTVAFTGHRNINIENVAILREELTHILSEQYNNGYRTFITGGARGFDLLASEVVLSLQEQLTDIQLFIAVPYAGHHNYFTQEDKQRYICIADNATLNIILSAYYYKECFLRRNDYMLEHSSLLIAYYGQSFFSGTGYTVRRAEANKIPTINLFK
ncbi:DUF1273 family protein [Dysgonomonas sp. 216]|uniref:SLOG family protein n=1 Tax=Dysgonomonas sp. 216 TaxID=2302934 RepID=UPI0013D0086F|nr:SLOG family protein [Dysgonomonas sp. 216]NDW18786.1 DUF1273 family protein [Dysgonomonas sp. 216]